MKQIRDVITDKIRSLGQKVILQGGEETVETWAMIDPVHSVSEAARSTSPLPDGFFPPGSYQYYGLPEGDLTEASTVVVGEIRYFIRRKELYQAGGQKLYWWALLIRGGTGDA